MIDVLEARLHEAMSNRAMVDAMLRGMAHFDRYRASLPLLPGGYTRTLLQKTGDFELVGMHWAPGSLSAIHDHGDSRCWVVVMEGMLDVDNYDRHDDGGLQADLTHGSSIEVVRGDLDHRLNRRELHKVRNTRDCSAYSLQLYSPSLTEYTVVNEQTGICSKAAALYDAVFDL